MNYSIAHDYSPFRSSVYRSPSRSEVTELTKNELTKMSSPSNRKLRSPASEVTELTKLSSPWWAYWAHLPTQNWDHLPMEIEITWKWGHRAHQNELTQMSSLRSPTNRKLRSPANGKSPEGQLLGRFGEVTLKQSKHWKPVNILEIMSSLWKRLFGQTDRQTERTSRFIELLSQLKMRKVSSLTERQILSVV